jgi:hypothetical protein
VKFASAEQTGPESAGAKSTLLCFVPPCVPPRSVSASMSAWALAASTALAAIGVGFLS